MNITYRCSNCDCEIHRDIGPDTKHLDCPQCLTAVRFPSEVVVENRVSRCAVCPSRDLFYRKDFSQRIGVAIVVLGIVASSVAWYYHWIFTSYGILFGTALIDVVLYALVGEVVVCYRCGSLYRDIDGIEEYGRFDLEIHERYRQEKARLVESSGDQVAVPSASAPSAESHDPAQH